MINGVTVHSFLIRLQLSWTHREVVASGEACSITYRNPRGNTAQIERKVSHGRPMEGPVVSARSPDSTRHDAATLQLHTNGKGGTRSRRFQFWSSLREYQFIDTLF